MKQFIIILMGLLFLGSAPSMAQSMTVKEIDVLKDESKLNEKLEKLNSKR